MENGTSDGCASHSNYQNQNSYEHFDSNDVKNDFTSKKSNKNFNRPFFRGRGKGRFIASQNEHSSKPSVKNDKSEAPYGNYPFYYGYRNQWTPDSRILHLKKEWITDKDVLDIGCNTGHLTLALARDFSPRMIVGMDIDPLLIRTAKKNTKHYLTDDIEYDSEFPISLVSQFGPLALAASVECENVKFPYNISFVQGNYVLESDDLLKCEGQKFDTILCLSITKWIQLNWGDEGLKRVFLRMHSQLKNGGHLILEPQPLKSYARSKRISETHRKHYAEMKLLPENFNDYLLKIVGFKTCELINNVQCNLLDVKGFERPMYLLTKGNDYAYQEPKHVIFHYEEDPDNTAQISDTEELSD